MYRVLTVDSSILSSQVLSYHLNSAGFEVEHCASQADFENILAGFRPHVVVYNLDMPQHSVAVHCGFLRSSSRPGGARVLLFSDADEERLKECVEQGFADGYYIKDPNLTGFAEKVGRMASGSG